MDKNHQGFEHFEPGMFPRERVEAATIQNAMPARMLPRMRTAGNAAFAD